MKKNIFLCAIMLFATFVFAQKYQTAGGIRVGNDLGLTVKQHVGNNWTLEAMATTKSSANESRLTLVGAKHFNFLGRGLNLYFGGGAHKGFVNEVRAGYEPTWGITTIGGMEATMGNYNFSVDVRPTYNFKSGTGQNVYNSFAALSVRYVFVDRESRFQSWKSKQKDRFKRKKS